MSLVSQIRAMLDSGLTIGQALDAADGIERGAWPKRASRRDVRAQPLPEEEKEWLTPELARFALDELGDRVIARRVTDAFINYWRSEGGARARKVHWGLTYKNWVMRDADKRGRSGMRMLPPSRQNGSDGLINALDNMVPRR